MKKYNEEFKIRVINEYMNNNISLRKVAKKYGLTHGIISYWIRGGNTYKNDINIKTNILKDIINDFNNGLTTRELNIKYNIPTKKLKKYLSKYIVEGTTYSYNYINNIIYDYEYNGLKLREIIKKYNIDDSTFYRWLQIFEVSSHTPLNRK